MLKKYLKENKRKWNSKENDISCIVKTQEKCIGLNKYRINKYKTLLASTVID